MDSKLVGTKKRKINISGIEKYSLDLYYVYKWLFLDYLDKRKSNPERPVPAISTKYRIAKMTYTNTVYEYGDHC